MKFVDYCSFQAVRCFCCYFQINSFGIHFISKHVAYQFRHEVCICSISFSMPTLVIEDVMINISSLDAFTNKCNGNNANEMKKKFMCKSNEQTTSILLQLLCAADDFAKQKKSHRLKFSNGITF